MGEVLMQPMGGGVGSDDVTAAKAQVLTGYNTVTTDSDDEVVAGTMPNNGAMNVTLTPSGNSSTNQAVAGGYYSGGTITANGSASYSSGYSQGVSDADGRVNTSSSSYNSGYSNGYNAGRAVGHSANLRVSVQHTGSGDVKCWVYLNNGQIGVWHQNANGVTKDAFNSTITI